MPKALSSYSCNLLCIFVAALALRLWFNFGTEHANAYGVADASEYLRYATAISKLNLAAPIYGPEWKEFSISGPAFPFFLVLCSIVSFSTFDASKSEIFVMAQSLISALSVVLIAVIGKQLWNEKTSYLAGAIAAIYPAFIVNSGRLYSETFATFLECIATAILIHLIFHKHRIQTLPLLLGASLVLLQLTRSSMVLFSICAPILLIANQLRASPPNWKAALIAASTTGLGMLLVLLPWFAFQNGAFSKMTPIVDRVGAYNLFIGTNTDTQGFLTYPYPDGRGIEEKSFSQLAREAFNKSPTRFLKLALDKPARLYKLPWNDFRVSIGPINFQTQVLIHQIVLLFSILGLCLTLTLYSPWQAIDDNEKRKLFLARFALLLTIILNLPFLAFITVPRYNLLAMPAIIILAASGITTLCDLLRNHRLVKSPKIAVLAAVFLFIYLRDDLRAPFSLDGIETASLYIVQGENELIRKITACFAVITLFSGLFFSIKLLNCERKTAACMTLLTAFAAITLSAIPQRANGRIGEAIVTLNRPGEKLSGQIFVSPHKLEAAKTRWFLLLDSDQGQLLKNQFSLSLNGKKLTAAPIASLTALDDWHYIKKFGVSKASYVECSYIFDCLTGPSEISNSELRQWFIFPLSEEQLLPIKKDGYVEIDIEQSSATPSKFFGSAHSKSGKRGSSDRIIPARALYSWEKAFYGVENDAGFTDTRLDEKALSRQGKWSISYRGSSEDIPNLDANIRLIKVELDCRESTASAGEMQPTLPSAKGYGEANLAVPANLLKSSNQLLTIRTSFEKSTGTAEPEKNRYIETQPMAPSLTLNWLSSDGRIETMCIPGLPKLTNNSPPLALSFVVDLNQTNGSKHQLHCSFPDKSCRIELEASSLNCHPLYSKQELF